MRMDKGYTNYTNLFKVSLEPEADLNTEGVDTSAPTQQAILYVPALSADIAKQEIAFYRGKCAEALDKALAFIIDSVPSNEQAVEFTVRIKKVAKELEAHRLRLVKEPSAFVHAVNTFVKTFSEKLVKAEQTLKQKSLTFARTEKLKAEEAHQRAMAAAAKLQKKVNKEAEQKNLVPITIPMPVAQPAEKVRTESGSSSVRKWWTFKVIDMTLVPAAYLAVSDTKVKDAIKAGMREIPGLEIYEEESMVIRT